MNTIQKALSLIAVCAGLILPGCSLGEQADVYSESLPKTGIDGRVFRGPLHGGPIEEGEVSEEGFKATFLIHTVGGGEVTSFESGNDGSFRVEVPAGSYQLIPDGSAPLLHPEQQVKEVAVVDGAFTTVDLHFDTGIR